MLQVGKVYWDYKFTLYSWQEPLKVFVMKLGLRALFVLGLITFIMKSFFFFLGFTCCSCCPTQALFVFL